MNKIKREVIQPIPAHAIIDAAKISKRLRGQFCLSSKAPDMKRLQTARKIIY